MLSGKRLHLTIIKILHSYPLMGALIMNSLLRLLSVAYLMGSTILSLMGWLGNQTWFEGTVIELTLEFRVNHLKPTLL